jgi:hypothetical protein
VQFTTDTTKVGHIADLYRLDLAVPEAPALSLLNVDGSKLLRPSEVRELAVQASRFVGSNGSLAFPKDLAVEVAPGLLIGGRRLSLAGYRKNRVWYMTRVSVATGRDTANRAALGVGLRLSLVNRADARLNPTVMAQVDSALAEVNDLYTQALLDCLRKRPPGERQEIKFCPLNPADSAQAQSIVDSLTALHRHWEERTWNALVWDVAIGSRMLAADSVGDELRAREGAVWSTLGLPVGSWGQLLMGGKAATVRDDAIGDWMGSLALSSRLYLGTNRYKAFLEAQGTAQEKLGPQWLLNSGAEAHLRDSIWASLSAGVNRAGAGDSRLVGRFLLRIAVPGLSG